MLSRALEIDVCIHRGPAFGENVGTLSRALEEGIHFFI